MKDLATKDDVDTNEDTLQEDVGNHFSFDSVKFVLECFVLSFGPATPHLGRNHPSSDPERYVKRALHLNQPQMTNKVSWTSRSSGHATSSSNVPRVQPPPPPGFAVRPNPDHQEGPTSFADEFILRELSEMRVLLERLLESRDGTADHDLLDLLILLPEHPTNRRDSSQSYPVGESGFLECEVCLDLRWLYRRACCNFPVCNACLEQYYGHKVSEGVVQIECCNPACQSYVHREEIAARLNPENKNLFYKLLSRANQVENAKTCPRCCHVLSVDLKERKKKNKIDASRVQCPTCALEWCFSCHAPWHENTTCRQFIKGDKLLKTWAKQLSYGQVNAQKCPKCKIYIQRTTGCDHMHCTGCKTDFCYRCGDRFRRLKFLGDHYSKLSVFGCKYRYKADNPVQRKLVRGAILGGKVAAAPALAVLAVSAGVMAVGLGVFALPLYGGIRLLRCYKAKHKPTLREMPTLLQYTSVNCP